MRKGFLESDRIKPLDLPQSGALLEIAQQPESAMKSDHTISEAIIGAALGFLFAFLQIVVWCLVSCTAGFCEEILYRGYLQRQFVAWTGSALAAIAIQAVIFGASHGYQGTKQMVIIRVLGALYGILSHWRRTLVPGMAAHAWSDIYGGWLHP